MKGTFLLKGFLFLAAICTSPSAVWAGTGKPFCKTGINEVIHLHLMQDTVPKPVKPAETTTPKKEVDVIKSIPVARKQPIPVPVKVKVTPVKITKPKILKPVINLLP
jgi:hypothetical protein